MNYIKELIIRIASSVGVLALIIAVMHVYNEEITLSANPLILIIIAFIVYLITIAISEKKYAELDETTKMPLWQVLGMIGAIVLFIIATFIWGIDEKGLFIPAIPILITVNQLINDVRRYKNYDKRDGARKNTSDKIERI